MTDGLPPPRRSCAGELRDEIEFETICFLQNHKTGCTLVETFLRRHCCEDIVRYEKHWVPSIRTSADGCLGIKTEPAQLAIFPPGDRALFDFTASFQRIVVIGGGNAA